MTVLPTNPPRSRVICARDAARRRYEEQAQRLPDGWVAAILDRSGTIVSRSKDTDRWVGKKVPGSLLINIAGSRHEGFAQGTSTDGIEFVSAWSRSPDWGWSVAISQPISEIRADFMPNLIVLILSGALAIFLGMLLASLVSRRISTATLGLAESAAYIGTSGYRQQESTGIAEIDSVNSRLTVASRLLRERDLQRNAAEDHQRLLTAELDHRVKTFLLLFKRLLDNRSGIPSNQIVFPVE